MNTSDSLSLCTAFDGHRRIASGDLAAVALAVKHAVDAHAAGPVLIYSDATGRLVDVDLRGSDAEIVARLTPAAAAPPDDAPGVRGRGRPKLGVVSREVTLLPRHWEWLAAQPGGASVALRKLVEEARRANEDQDRLRQRQEAAYAFMSSIAGDMPGFEEATRALFAGDPDRFAECVADWPADIREHATRLAFA
ncbi:DUF2239 family protein [Bordetella genomosp. 2]|uniref:DUF2239 domain-containing protein n=1 Tax=Bordetella genomosp. 2 TaxID=1983456 RepID=A0A261W1P9_9BORD|nr:DUF2239 family protein [Bordetella genomosp. 2]OZI79961.1 hypothetical protein CAL24_08635 [Bordetella genomosp. 2]